MLYFMYSYIFSINKFKIIKITKKSYQVILAYQVEAHLSELNNPVKPVVSLLCEGYLFFLSPFYILYSITFVIHDFPVQQ